MTTTIDPTIGRNGAWAEGVQRASQILDMLLRRSQEPVTASWALVSDDRGRPLLELTLSDFASSVATRFETEELEDGEHLWKRLNRLWGDLLQARLHKQVEHLLQSAKGLEEE